MPISSPGPQGIYLAAVDGKTKPHLPASATPSITMRGPCEKGGRHGAPCSAEWADHVQGPRAGREQADPAGRRVGQPQEHAGTGGNENEHELQPRPGRTVFTGHEVRQSLLLSLGRAVITKPAGEEVRNLHPNSSTRAKPPPPRTALIWRAPKIQSGNTHPASGQHRVCSLDTMEERLSLFLPDIPALSPGTVAV